VIGIMFSMVEFLSHNTYDNCRWSRKKLRLVKNSLVNWSNIVKSFNIDMVARFRIWKLAQCLSCWFKKRVLR